MVRARQGRTRRMGGKRNGCRSPPSPVSGRGGGAGGRGASKKELRQRRARASLQRTEEGVVGFGHAVARAQVVLDALQQLGRHFGVGQRAVGAAGARQLEPVHQAAQFVAPPPPGGGGGAGHRGGGKGGGGGAPARG